MCLFGIQDIGNFGILCYLLVLKDRGINVCVKKFDLKHFVALETVKFIKK